MSVRRLDPVQPDAFSFSPVNEEWAKALMTHYPKGREASALVPLLWRAQEQNGGWLPRAAMEYVGNLIDVPFVRVYEVATFYTMFQLSPVGKKAHIQVCGTTPCMLRGSGELLAVCRKKIAPMPHALSEDGNFSWEEVECLGACVNAPLVQIGAKTYEDLTPQAFEGLLEALDIGKTPACGPQNGRWLSAPQGLATSLEGAAAEMFSKGPVEEVLELTPPPGLSAPRGGMPDVLEKISGVSVEGGIALYALGVYHYDQIAQWTTAQALWVDRHLGLSGKVLVQDWMGQAARLWTLAGEGV